MINLNSYFLFEIESNNYIWGRAVFERAWVCWYKGKQLAQADIWTSFLLALCASCFFRVFPLFVCLGSTYHLTRQEFYSYFCHVRSKTERFQVRLLLIPYFLPFSVGSNIEFRNLLTHFVSLNSSFLKWYLRISKIITILQSHQANSVEQSLHNKRSGRLLTNLHF